MTEYKHTSRKKAPARSEDALQAEEEATEKPGSSSPERHKDSPPTSSPYARAANEDDDGYDPWSDRREEPTVWEEDPWR